MKATKRTKSFSGALDLSRSLSLPFLINSFSLCEFGFDEEDVIDALEDNENDEIDALFQLLAGCALSRSFIAPTRKVVFN